MGYLAIWDYLCSVNRRDGYLLRVLQNSKITYRPHCPGTGGGAFFYVSDDQGFFASEAAEPSAVIILAEGQQTVAPHAAIT